MHVRYNDKEAMAGTLTRTGKQVIQGLRVKIWHEESTAVTFISAITDPRRLDLLVEGILPSRGHHRLQEF